MREIKYISLRAKYERRVFVIYTVLKKISLVLAIVGILLLVIIQLCSNVFDDNIITNLGILSFCTLMASPITILSAMSYYASAEDYSEYLEKKNKKWLI